MAVNVASTLLAVAVAVVLARSLGPEGYGIYAYVFALASLLAIPAQFGLPNLVIRETAEAQANEHWGLMRGLWRWASSVAGAMSLGLALAAGGMAWTLYDQVDDAYLTTFAWGLLLVPLTALGNLRGAALQGLRRVVAGQLPEHVLRPGLLVLFVLAVLLWPSGALTAARAMALHALAAATAFLIGAWMLWRLRPEPLTTAPVPTYEQRRWIASALPLAMVAAMALINQHTDVLVLGLFRSPAEVGIYKVVLQGGVLVVFGLQAINKVVAPHFARLKAHGDMARLQLTATMSARASLAMALPVVLVFIFFGKPILRWVFGKAFAAGHTALAIIAVGQLMNAAMGSVGSLLNMTGYERDTARGVAIAAACNIVLNFLLIPFLGINGAALATALTLTIWNLLLCRDARRRLGIRSSIMGPL